VEAVRDLCARLDGLPLAAELAAARVRVMSVAEIARRLDDRFALLRGGRRDAPERHRTLRDVIDWSWHLLDPAGQAAMRVLSVFPGGFTAAAARHVTGDDAVVEQLVDQSLVKVADSGDGTRFRMVETVREFSAARREEAGETEEAVDRFLGWARDFEAGTDLMRMVGEIRAEQDNLVQALRYGLDRHDGPSVAVTAALLGTLWITDSNLARLGALAADVPEVLSRLRPSPDLVEAVRAAAVWCALSAYLTRGTRPLRALVTLRRLPPPDPDTMIGAAQVALCAPDGPALAGLCDSDRPLVAGAAGYALSYLLEVTNDPRAALRAARRTLACFERDASPWLLAFAHARIGELCLWTEPGQEAYRHLAAALSIMEDLGAWSSAARARWAIVLANLQRGAFDEAEEGLDQLAHGSMVEESGRMMFDTCTRAEILLGRGDVDGGLRLWRRAADGLRSSGAYGSWAREVYAATVVAHALHGRLDLAGEIVGTLPEELSAMLPSASAADFPACGSLLLAIALADLGRGDVASGVRMAALAERFGFRLDFQPVMSAGRAREFAERAGRTAYTEAVSSYAALGDGDLPGAALALLHARLDRADRA
jgi:hypothetical protein